MKKHVLLAVLLTLGLGCALWPAVGAADGDVKKDEPRPAVAADEDLLKAAGLTGDGIGPARLFPQADRSKYRPGENQVPHQGSRERLVRGA